MLSFIYFLFVMGTLRIVSLLDAWLPAIAIGLYMILRG